MVAARKTVEVQQQGGRTMRPAAMSNFRHNKVYTAKGPRDQRVRLSAETAIQFFDVQDRLGCKRASDALDWLILKAKDSIQKLYEKSSSKRCEQLNLHGTPVINVQSTFPVESMLQKEDPTEPVYHSYQYGLTSTSNSSMSFPHIHVDNCASEMSYKVGHENYTSLEGSLVSHQSSPSSMVEHSAVSSLQGVLVNDPIQSMTVTDLSDYTASFPQPTTAGLNYASLPSLFIKEGWPDLNLSSMPNNCTTTVTESENQWPVF